MEKTLGMRIGEYRRAKGLKQDELSEMLGVSPQAVSKWENDVSCPDIMTLPKLAKIFEVTTDALLTGENESKPEVKYSPETSKKCFDEMVLKIKVDAVDEKEPVKVRVNLPLPLIKVLFKSGADIGSMVNIGDKVPAGTINWEQLITLIESGVVGKLVEIDCEDAHVEIVVE